MPDVKWNAAAIDELTMMVGDYLDTLTDEQIASIVHALDDGDWERVHNHEHVERLVELLAVLGLSSYAERRSVIS